MEVNPKYKKYKERYEALVDQFNEYRKKAAEEINSYRTENELFRKRLNANDLPTHTDDIDEPAPKVQEIVDNADGSVQTTEEDTAQPA